MTKASKKSTDQVFVTPPQKRNPTGKGGFADNPQNRNPGGWKKEDTPRYKLERMMNLSEEELEGVSEDKAAPLFERKLATHIKNGDWKVIESMVNQVYGTPKQTIEQTNLAPPEPLEDLRKEG